MKARLVIGAFMLVAAAGVASLAWREGRFTQGAPFVGVFAHVESAGRCQELPPDELLVFTPREMFTSYDREWRRGRRVESREVWLAWERPAVHLRAFTDDGGRIELLAERSGEGGFELLVETTIEPSGARVNHPHRANRPHLVSCAPPVQGHPWLDAAGQP